jgi:hypothetical protein
MQIDLDKLEELRKAATAGPYGAPAIGAGAVWSKSENVAVCVMPHARHDRARSARDAEYLAALLNAADELIRMARAGRGESHGSLEAGLHTAICEAASILSTAPDVIRCADGRKARDILRQALIDYADAFMDQPATEDERSAIHRGQTSAGKEGAK